MNRRISRDTVSSLPRLSTTNQAASGSASTLEDEENVPRSRSTNVLSELEEESAHLSSLVHQESLRRSSLPPHMVALPPSLPVSPISPRSPGGTDWLISRAASIARAHSLARHRLSSDQYNTVERQNSIARRRVQSTNTTPMTSMNASPSPTTTNGRANASVPIMPRSESPTPLPRNAAAAAAPQTSEISMTRPVLSLSTSEASLEETVHA